MTIRWSVVLSVLAIGCSDPQPAIQPVQSTGPRPTVVETPEEILNPSSSLRQRSTEERAAERERLGLTGTADTDPTGSAGGVGGGGGGGGGGGAGEYVAPHPEPPHSARDVERFRQELVAELGTRIDPEDDPCEQFRDTASAGNSVINRGSTSVPDMTRAEARRACARMSAEQLQCQDRRYFMEHQEECLADIDRRARQGQRIADRARAQAEERANGGRGLRSPSDGDDLPEDGSDIEVPEPEDG